MASTSNKKQASSSGTKINKQSPEPPIASTSHKSTGSMGLGLIIIAIGTSLVGLGGLGYLFCQELLSGSQRELEQATSANTLQIETKLANIQQTVQGVASAARVLSQQQPKPTSFVPYQRLVAESLPTATSLVGMGIASSGNLLFPAPRPNVTYVWKEKAGLNLGVTGQKLPGGNQLLFANRPDIQKEASYQQALKGQVVWSQPYQSLGTTIVTYNVPIKDGQRTLGVVNADAIASDIFSLKAIDPNLEQKLGFVVINSGGKVISASEQFQAADPVITEALTSLTTQAKSQPTGVTQTAGNIWAYRKVAGSDWVVATYLPTSSVLGKLLIPLGGVLLGVSAILAIAISNFVGSLKKRLQPLNEECAQFLDQRGHSSANITGKDEIDQLGLLLKGTFQQIKVDEIHLRNELLQSSGEVHPEAYTQSDSYSEYVEADADLSEHDDVDLMDVVASLDDDIPSPSLTEQAVAITPNEVAQTDIDDEQNLDLDLDLPDFGSDFEPIIVETAEGTFAQAQSQELEISPANSLIADSLTNDEAFLEEELLTELKHEVYDQDEATFHDQVESSDSVEDEHEYDPLLADATSSFVEDTSFGIITPLPDDAFANVPTSVDFNIPDMDDDFHASESEMTDVIDDASLFFSVSEPSATTETSLESSADFDPFASDTPFATETESFAVEADDVFAVSSSDLNDLGMNDLDDDTAYGAETYTEQSYDETSEDAFSFDSSIDYIPSEEDEAYPEPVADMSGFDASINYSPDEINDEFNEFIDTPLESAVVNPFEHDEVAVDVISDNYDEAFDQIFDTEDVAGSDEPVAAHQPLSNTENVFAFDQDLAEDLDQGFSLEPEAFAETDLNNFADLSPELDAFVEPVVETDLNNFADLSAEPEAFAETDLNNFTDLSPELDAFAETDLNSFADLSPESDSFAEQDAFAAQELNDFAEIGEQDEMSAVFTQESAPDQIPDIYFEEPSDAVFATDISATFVGDTSTSEYSAIEELEDEESQIFQSVSEPIPSDLEDQDYSELHTNEPSLVANVDADFDFTVPSLPLDDMNDMDGLVGLPAEEDLAAFAQDSEAFSDLGSLTEITSEIGEQDQLNDDFDSLWQANEIDETNELTLPAISDPFTGNSFADNEYTQDLNDPFSSAIAEELENIDGLENADAIQDISTVADENMEEFANLFENEDEQFGADVITDTVTDNNPDLILEDDEFAPASEDLNDSQPSLEGIFENDSFDLDSLEELNDLPQEIDAFSDSSNDELDETFDESDLSSIFSMNLDESAEAVSEKSLDDALPDLAFPATSMDDDPFNLSTATPTLDESMSLDTEEDASLNFSETWLENATTDAEENANFNIEAFEDFDDLGVLSTDYPSLTGISTNAVNDNLNNDLLDSLTDQDDQDWESLGIDTDTATTSTHSDLSALDLGVSAFGSNSLMANEADEEFDLSAFDDLDEDLVNSARSEIEDFLAGSLNIDDLSDESFETIDKPNPKKDDQDKTVPKQST
ncbi:PDC sensor domain-containing protein [Pseudanabaena mucicola]|uniref:Cache domain-containing protein n=1 Tax=Pseudanabaena mucicola FACHB-723 TaxID=2692860 RepID=A0ABR7ZTR1_9CYAN|nr:hypothetical protein [Pseudanabaena mucicola]MBD2187341.1 hypothetical protein [Pseudanabaena mucicola FACHB-723]